MSNAEDFDLRNEGNLKAYLAYVFRIVRLSTTDGQYDSLCANLAAIANCPSVCLGELPEHLEQLQQQLYQAEGEKMKPPPHRFWRRF